MLVNSQIENHNQGCLTRFGTNVKKQTQISSEKTIENPAIG